MDAKTIAIASILIWIGGHTGYNIHIPWPTIEYMDEVSLQKYADSSYAATKHDEIVGVYSPTERNIAMVEDTDIRTPDGKSTLFHEIFHHVQNLNENKRPKLLNDCEKEAYKFENLWRKEHHLKPTYIPDLSTGNEPCY